MKVISKQDESHMIVVVGGIKGGSGKTTIATNLTVMRSASGKKVLLVDADEQRSASDWAEQRENLKIQTNWTTIQLAGKQLYHQILRFKPDYDDIIIDVGGRDTTSQRSALAIADVFLVPFKPRSLDIWTIGAVKTMLHEIFAVNPKLKSFAIINQADAKGSDNEDAINILSEGEELKLFHNCLGQRKSFANAAAEGLGVTELPKRDPKAVQEMTEFYDRLYGYDINNI